MKFPRREAILDIHALSSIAQNKFHITQVTKPFRGAFTKKEYLYKAPNFLTPKVLRESSTISKTIKPARYGRTYLFFTVFVPDPWLINPGECMV